MTKLPAIQWYPNDWQNDMGVQSLSFEERGIWWEILQRMHQSEVRGKMVLNAHPMSDEEIAHIIHCDVAKLKQALKQILSKGVASLDTYGALYSRRMVNDEKFRKTRADSGSLGGKQKASNRLANDVAKSTPSSSVSSSSSVSTSTKSKSFVAPNAEEVTAYAKTLNFKLDGGRFVDYYAALGWMRGKTKIRDWRACVRTWKKNEENQNGKPLGAKAEPDKYDGY